MSEEVKENGTQSEEVPEIELIIKVRLFHSYYYHVFVCTFGVWIIILVKMQFNLSGWCPNYKIWKKKLLEPF